MGMAQRGEQHGDIVGVADEGVAKCRMVFHIPHMDGLAHAQAMAEDSLVQGDAGQAQVAFERARIAFRLFADFHRNPDQWRTFF